MKNGFECLVFPCIVALGALVFFLGHVQMAVS